ncbi:hypothetical protein [Thalassovita sp.]|uniref:hypothetical protein n=1 Tax=Thalassovita sp. TaxID=1979401 RepID=UPI002AB1EA8F|nr:hypothetical protein [Thalassovita sp.]
MDERGSSDCMGPKLRAFVEEKLIADLNQYLPEQQTYQRSDIQFDWSARCVEGHRMRWLDGEIENFSGIAILHKDSGLIAEGWMEFIEAEDGLEVFWWFLTGVDQTGFTGKDTNTVPSHVWNRLSTEVRTLWRNYAPKKPLT